ncbi:hypothetical protein OGZ01_00830 [Vibrio harveyi]|nr:hypothetical protein [Vibrio harveyi]
MREKMEVGEKEAMSKATQTLKSFVEQQRIEEVKSQLVGSSVDLLNSLDNAHRLPAIFGKTLVSALLEVLFVQKGLSCSHKS